MTLTAVRIAAATDSSSAAQTFAKVGVVQIPQFLEAAAAEAIGDLLPTLPYAIVAPDPQGETLVIGAEAIRRFGEAQVRSFLIDTLKRASSGFAFIHQSYALQDEYGRDSGAPIARVTEFLQSRVFLDFGAAVIGRPVDGVRVQASNYRRGDFLTVHDDSHLRDDRLAAFTLSFTRGWRPDWGGQLLFHDDQGDVTHGYAPRFNMLTVFRVPQPHSVAPVAAYAAAPRVALTGWFIRGGADGDHAQS